MTCSGSGGSPILAMLFGAYLLSFAVLSASGQELPTFGKKTAEEVLPKKPYSPYVEARYRKAVRRAFSMI